MLLVLYSKLNRIDLGVESLFFDACKARGHNFYSFDMHSFFDGKAVLEMRGTECIFNGIPINEFSSVLCLSIPRIDSLLRHNGAKFPGRNRQQAESFLVDLALLLGEVKWVPGDFTRISAGNSKMKLFKTARECGLNVPETTIYGKLQDLKISGNWYRKSLGFPCVTTFSVEKGREMFMRFVNSRVDIAGDTGSSTLLQWQEPISGLGQIRSIMVGEKIRSRIWYKEEDYLFTDLREMVSSEQLRQKIIWQDYELPPGVVEATRKLMSKIGLTVAAPEFFVTEDGSHILFDLNPCGDFSGFFEQDRVNEIIHEILDLAM